MRQKAKSILSGIGPYYCLLGFFAIVGLYLTSLYDYLLFHSLVELFSIIVAVLIFAITWNTRDKIENNYLFIIGTAYLFIGGIDLVHTLAYEGMGVFPGLGANLPTQLWISARYMEALTLLIAPLLLYRDTFDVSYPMIAYGVGSTVIVASVFGGFFPTCYVEGVGLTLFKKVSEYVISIVLVFSLYFLYRYRERFKRYVFRLLAVSIVLTIGAEIAFTFYVSVYGFSNLVGHLFKLGSFFLIYQALIVTGFREPFDLLYRELKEREEDLERSKEKVERERDRAQAYLDLAGSIIVALDREGKVTLINRKGREILGREESEIVGKNWFENFVPEEKKEELKKVHERLMSGEIEEPGRYENPVLTKSGEERIIFWYNTPLENDEGEIMGSLSSGIDITDRKRAEEREDFLNTLIRQDLKSKYQTIQGYNQLLEEEADLSDKHREYLRKAIRAGREADEILGLVKKLEEIEGTEGDDEKDVVKILEHVTNDISSLVKTEGVEIEEDYPEDTPKVKGDYSLNTLFTQLLVTRIQLGGCDRIRIDASEREEDILLKVEDDGKKLPEDVKNMFSGEPYTGETTGVGGVRYYMLREIARHNKADIEVKDSELGGVRFDIQLEKV